MLTWFKYDLPVKQKRVELDNIPMNSIEDL